jgi:hypothetical protein
VSLPVRIAERQGPPGRYEVSVGTQTAADKAVWPYGLAANLLLGASAVALTTRCLKAPYARLPKAVQVP